MPKKINTEDFIVSSKKIHGDNYDYSKTEYISSGHKLLIICPQHGEFWQEANSHKQGHGCKHCYYDSNLQTEEEFIKNAKLIHSNEYDYSIVDFSKGNKKVEIICPKHGIFRVFRRNHLRGDKCNKCQDLERGLKRRIKKSEFLKRANEIHNNKYDYSLVEFSNSKEKIRIICSEHGIFEQQMMSHLMECGCPKCGTNVASSKTKTGKKEFIRRAKEIHGDKYDYSKVVYVNKENPVIIICPEHGEFEQIAHNHINKNNSRGCIDCGGSKKHTNETFVNKSIDIHGEKYDYSRVNYVNAYTNVEIVCKKHGVFLQTPTTHLSGGGCVRCINKSEGRLAIILKEIGVVFRNHRIENRLFDFYLPEYDLIIERDGEQHYFKEVKHWGTVKDNHQIDIEKTNLAKSKGHNICRIPYWLSEEDEKKEIQNILNGQPTYPDVPDLEQSKTKPLPN